jgi:competence protein ComGC
MPTHAGMRWPMVRPAFSLMDVMVTMAVIAVLISLLTPALSSVRETAHQVICRSNVRQLAIGMGMFAEDNKDRIPPSLNVTPPDYVPWATTTLRFGEGLPSKANKWDGLGHLYGQDYLPAPRLYYCPSHHGNHPYLQYSPRWGGQLGAVVGNYQYRGSGPSSSAAGGPGTTRLTGMPPGTALIADGLSSQLDFNHRIGANFARADLSISWFHDRSGSFIDMLPKEGDPQSAAIIEGAWGHLDH